MLGRGTRKALGPAASFSCRPAPAAGNKGAAGLGRAAGTASLLPPKQQFTALWARRRSEGRRGLRAEAGGRAANPAQGPRAALLLPAAPREAFR